MKIAQAALVWVAVQKPQKKINMPLKVLILILNVLKVHWEIASDLDSLCLFLYPIEKKPLEQKLTWLNPVEF